MTLNKAEFQGALWWWYFSEDLKPDGYSMDSNWDRYQKDPNPDDWGHVLKMYKQLTSGNGKVVIR